MNAAFPPPFVTPGPAAVTMSVLTFVSATLVLLEMEKLAAVRNGRFVLLVVTAPRKII